MLESIAEETAEDGEQRRSREPDDLPEVPHAPYHSDLLTAIADWVQQWNNPEFSIDIVERVDPRLSVSGARLLTRLYAQGALRPSDLAAQLLTGASNVSKLLAQLESLGFVERRPDTGDARVIQVQLTEAGRLATEEVIAGSDRAIEHMTRDWTEEEIRTYAAQTRRLAAAGRDYVRKLRSESAEA